MTTKLHLGTGLNVPTDAVTQTFAFMGKRGAGKTYAAGKLVEEMLGAGAQVVVVDPVGNWWGLRLAADGKKAGIAIPVFGGDHGDIPLHAGAGALFADVIVEKHVSAVLDVSHLRKGDRQCFITDFAEQLFHRKKTDRSAMHLVFEEAHVFIPQRIYAGQERMLGAMEDIVKLGRNYGIGISLVDQRPQAVNKDVLNQTECLLAFQLIGKHERKSIEEWAEDKGIGKAEASKLSTLPIGTAIVWSPTWLEFFDKVPIGRKKTYDASATPKAGAAHKKVGTLAEIDLEKLRASLAEVATAAADNDPKKLRKRIIELERALAVKAQATNGTERIVTRPVSAVTPQEIEKLQAAVADIDAAVETLVRDVRAARKTLNTIALSAAKAIERVQQGKMPFEVPSPRAAASNGHRRPPVAVSDPVQDDGDLGKGPRAFLTALAMFDPAPVTRNQASTLAGYSPKSSTTRAYLGKLRGAGLIQDVGSNALQLTSAGKMVAGTAQQPTSTEDLLNLWCPRLGKGPEQILRLLVGAYPAAMSRSEIEANTEYSATSSTMRAYLGKLRSNGLIAGRGDEFYAADELFPSRRRG